MLQGQIKICPEGCGLMTGWSEAEFPDSRAPGPLPTQPLRSEPGEGQVLTLAWDLLTSSPLGSSVLEMERRLAKPGRPQMARFRPQQAKGDFQSPH